MALRTPDTREEQDQAYNPSQDYYDQKFNEMTAGYSSSADDLQKLENYANEGSGKQGKPSDAPTKNIDDTKQQEEDGGGSGWINNYSSSSKSKTTGGKFKALRSKGPLGFIIALLLGGGGAFSIILAPGIGIVQLKEILTEDLNDQLGATSLRSDHMLRARLKGVQAGASVCSDGVKIRCKFTTMSNRQVEKFKKAGFTVETDTVNRTIGRDRQRITSLSYTDRQGNTIVISDPQDLTNAARTNPEVRSALRKAFNPKFAGLSDGIAQKVFGRFKTDKTQKVTGDTDEDRDKAVDASTSGEKAGMSAKGHYTDPESNRNYVLDENNQRVYESGENSDPDKFKEISEKNKANLADIEEKANNSSPGSKAVSGVFTSLGKGLSLTGAIDTACTVYNTARAVSAAAKIARALQLVQYFMVFAVTADRIKAGDAKPGEVEYIGDKLTAIDTRKMIEDESTIEGSSDSGDLISEPVENPHYGHNAFDSEGYAVAAYNDAPTLSSSATQYMIGGALSGKLADVLDTIDDVIPGSREGMRDSCAVVQSWWARTIGLIGGLISAVGTFGASTVVSIGVSVAIGFALPFLEAALADIIAGNVVSSATESVDAGNATFTGAGALLGGMAQNRGMQPASSEEFETYVAATSEVKREIIAAETYEARDTPFDVMNQYSFLGSAVRSINPAILQSTSSVSAAVINIPTIIGTAFSSVVPHVNADQEFNPERFSKCEDAGYAELNIDADIFCNPRYFMSNRALNMPTEEALNWMLSNGHINDDGSPKSDDYESWIKNCAEREDGWGESSKDDGVTSADVGKDCVKEEFENRNTYFQVYYMDLGIANAMDEDLSGSDTGAATVSGEWVNPAGSESYTISSEFGPRVLSNGDSSSHDGTDLSFGGQEGADFVSACSGTIKSVGRHGNHSGQRPTNIIKIDCGDGIEAWYMHYYTNTLADGVTDGATISAGDKLAKVGNQGYSFGAHLHFQINQEGQPIDPVGFMDKMGVKL